MRAAKAAELGLDVRAWVEGWHFPALDPRENMLLGNVQSMPKALEKAGKTLADMDIVEIHEAFAAQVLANIRCLESDDYCKDVLGLDGPAAAAGRRLSRPVLLPSGEPSGPNDPAPSVGRRPDVGVRLW